MFVGEALVPDNFYYRASFSTPIMKDCYQVVYRGVTYSSSFNPKLSTDSELASIIRWPECP